MTFKEFLAKKHLKSQFRNLNLVWNWNTRHARKRWLRGPHFPSAGTADQFKELCENGIVTMQGGPTEIRKLQDYMKSIKTRYTNSWKPFLIEYWPTAGVLDFDNPFVKLALEPTTLNFVSAYLGCWPRLHDFRLWETRVMKEGEKKIYSQMWHRDPEDKRLLNMFIYLNDVDGETGPFQYVPGSHIDGPYWKYFPQLLPPYGSYPGDERVEKVLGKKVKTFIAPAGTVIWADTAGLHKGGYSTGKPRFMFKALYITDGNFPNSAIRYKLPPVVPSFLADIQKYAVGILR